MNGRNYLFPEDKIDEKEWSILGNTMRCLIFENFIETRMVDLDMDLGGIWNIPGDSLIPIVYLCLGFSEEERFSPELRKSNEAIAEYIGVDQDLPDTETRLMRGELDLPEESVWEDIRDRVDDYTNRLIKNNKGSKSEDFDDVAYQCAVELCEVYLGDGWRALYGKE